MNNLYITLEIFTVFYKTFLQKIGRKFNIGPTQVLILEYIKNNEMTSNNLIKISNFLNRRKSTISHSINTLFKKGYITKEKDENDSRVLKLKITHKGELTLNEYKNMLNEIVLYDKFTDYEKNVIIKFLSEIIKNLHNRNIIKNIKFCLSCKNYQENKDPYKYYCKIKNNINNFSEIKYNCNYYN